MDVQSRCRLRTGSIVWQTRAGAWALTVACKATYRLLPVESPLAEEQDEINEEDTYWNDDDARSLSSASDLAPFKPRADVLLVGYAFAPKGQPVRVLPVRLCVGEVDKGIDVWCDRGFMLDGRLLEGPRFTKMSLRYERAAGGPETTNPAGIRFDAPPDMYGMVPIPNLQPPGRHVAWRGDTFEPIGFGPIAPAWPARADKLYRHAAEWSHRTWFDRPLPEDIDPGYFNAAPRDQQVDAIRANERILLEGLHPEHPRLVTSLVEVRPRAVVERPGQAHEEIALSCDTLLIDTERALCTLLWRGRVGLRRPNEVGRVVITEAGGAAGKAAHAGMKAAPDPSAVPGAGSRSGAGEAAALRREVEAALSPLLAGGGGITGTLVPSPEQAMTAAQAPATPFVKGAPGTGISRQGGGAPKAGEGLIAPPPLATAPRPVAQPPMMGPLAAGVGRVPASNNEESVITVTAPMAPAREPLPFKPVLSSEGPPGWSGVPAHNANEAMGSHGDEVTVEGLKRFVPPDRSGAASVVEEPPRPPFGGMGVAGFPGGAFSAGALSPGAPGWNAEPVITAKSLAEEVDVAQSSEPPPPPPMIGPLARVDMDSPQPATDPEPPPSPPAPTEAPPAPALRPQISLVDVFPVEKCAAMTASIARRRAEEARILEENEIDSSMWEAIKEYWAEMIRKETARGKRELLRKYDWAYVEQIEKERGPIQVSEYALLTIAAERGEMEEVLARFTLPRGAMMRIERVWMEKMGKNAALWEGFQAAVEALRDA
ncbi:MAG TPA: DUF2169 domain-containing protein [Polyangiaceae bacterium]|nr:DUF2169 domain-containing protein [Polyangiaceae bacterium]